MTENTSTQATQSTNLPTIQLYDSMSGEKRPFIPRTPGQVAIYVCGPTVYGDPHLGHAKNYIGYDIMLRYFRHAGYHTFYVQNITDVGHLLGEEQEGEDRILKKARELSIEPMAVAEQYTWKYYDAMDSLNVLRPDVAPRATGHIPEQLELIEELLRRGFAYEVNGSVYFDVNKDPQYGQLSNRSLDDMVSGTRVQTLDEKRDPRDFALWKAAGQEHLMRWRDPWSGWGYPGWHTECVVMSLKYLKAGFDIHGGGMDLKFPHHESELAQARCVGKDYAKYWVHGNMLTIEGQKMSKSAGNFVSLEDAISQFGPLTLRYFIAACHYRSVLDYSEEGLQAAANALKKLLQTVENLAAVALPEAGEPEHFLKIRQRFCEAMNDDFNTPQALAALFELRKQANLVLSESPVDVKKATDALTLFRQLGGEVLGVVPQQIPSQQADHDLLEQVMQLVIEVRATSRSNKDFATADRLRNRLTELGIRLVDGKEGTIWELDA